MTNYATDTTSVQGSRPLELFVFSVANTTYRYTSRDVSIVYSGDTYTPAIITHNDTAVPTLQDTPELVLEIPITDAMIVAYGFWRPPPQNFTCTVYRYQITSAVAVAIWQGKVSGISIEGTRAKILVPSLLGDAMETMVPSRYFGQQCGHVLFDEGCTLSQEDYKHPTTVASPPSGRTVVVASLGSSTTKYYVNGRIRRVSDGERRQIVTQTTTTLTIDVAFNDLDNGDDVELLSGCDKLVSTCKNRYGNVPNFGGHPDVPTINPFAPHRHWWAFG